MSENTVGNLGVIAGVLATITAAITWVVTRLSGKQYCPTHGEQCARFERMEKKIENIYSELKGKDGQDGISQRVARIEEHLKK